MYRPSLTPPVCEQNTCHYWEPIKRARARARVPGRVCVSGRVCARVCVRACVCARLCLGLRVHACAAAYRGDLAGADVLDEVLEAQLEVEARLRVQELRVQVVDLRAGNRAIHIHDALHSLLFVCARVRARVFGVRCLSAHTVAGMGLRSG